MYAAVTFGLLAALCWGFSDFLAKISAEKIGALRTALFLQYVGILFLLLIVIPDLPRLWQFPTEATFTLVLGAVNAAAAFSLFKGFEVGQLSIVSPIASSYPALSTALAILLLNETLSPLQLAGLLAILAGIILVSFESKHARLRNKKRMAAGVGYALVAFLSLGFLFFALKFVVGDLGAFLPVLLVRLMAASVLTGMVILTRKQAHRHGSGYLPFVVVIGVVDTLGNVSYNLGIGAGAVSVVSTISGLFTAVTILLAFAVLKERLVVHQLFGLLAILVGVSIIGYVT